MLRVSKLTDYGTVVMGCLAQAPRQYHKAVDVAARTGVALPTVSKLLKQLVRGNLIESIRGHQGGYRLLRDAADISVAEIVRALEGPVAVTECCARPGLCHHEASCSIQFNWQKINRAVLRAIEEVSLAELIGDANVLTRTGKPSPLLPRRATNAHLQLMK